MGARLERTLGRRICVLVHRPTHVLAHGQSVLNSCRSRVAAGRLGESSSAPPDREVLTLIPMLNTFYTIQCIFPARVSADSLGSQLGGELPRSRAKHYCTV